MSARQRISQPPALVSHEAEEAVIGSLLIDTDGIFSVRPILTPEDFSLSDMAEVYRAMLAVVAGGGRIDYLTVCDQLRLVGKLDGIGHGSGSDRGQGFLTGLVSNVPTSMHLVHYAKIVRDYRLRREISQNAAEAVRMVHEEPDPQVAVQRALSLLSSVVRDADVGLRSSQEAVDGLMVRAQEWLRDPSKLWGMSTGLPDLDQLTGGLERGEFVILAGRPSVGKSAAALQIARNIAESGVGVAFFSLEMAIEQLMMRLACSVAEIDSDLLRRGQITKDEETRFWQTMAKLQQLPIYWSCKPGISGFEVESEVAKLRLRRDIGLVVVDYIQLMASDGESQNIRVSRSSQSLAQIAKGSDVCVLGLSQLSRAIESRDSSEPRMSDLRDSGGLENDADKIIFLWRERGEGLTVEELKKPIRTPMSLAKNRNGVANVAFRTMLFQGKYSRFVQESHDTEPF